MTLTAFILIFFSVILHASWHFISKSRKPVCAFFLIVSASCILTTLPFALTSGLRLSNLPPEFYLVLLGGSFCGMICDIGLSCAYRLADVSLAYPLARALPVLMTVWITIIFGLGSAPGHLAISGMVVIFFGCMMMPLKHFSDFKWSCYWNKALLGILVAAAGTTGYTIFDSLGLQYIREYGGISRFSGSAAYSCMREILLFCMLSVFVLAQKRERAQIHKDLFLHPHPYFAGVFAATAYLLVLIAMGYVTNVSYVQAFRQMSLPIGVLLGIFVLKEKCSLPKLIGIILVISGLVIVSI